MRNLHKYPPVGSFVPHHTRDDEIALCSPSFNGICCNEAVFIRNALVKHRSKCQEQFVAKL